jgi:ferredoxin
MGVVRKNASPEVKVIIEWIFIIFENGIRSITTIIGFYLTIRYVKISRGKISKFRLISFFSFSVSFLFLYLILPFILRFTEFYVALMPFPWASLPFQAPITGAHLTVSLTKILGWNGVVITLCVFYLYQLIVFIGTIFLGRRWQCGMLCTFVGAHAEAFGEALPLIPHNKDRPRSKVVNLKIRTILFVFQIFMIVICMTLMVAWGIYFFAGTVIIPVKILITIERMKYLFFELYLMIFFMLFVGARAYCYYCPAGTLLGVIGKIAGQQITTGLTKCNSCGLCNDVCKMSIDIMSKAKTGEPVKSINCVGCGVCVETCPTGNLQFTTSFLTKYRNRKASSLLKTE